MIKTIFFSALLFLTTFSDDYAVFGGMSPIMYVTNLNIVNTTWFILFEAIFISFFFVEQYIVAKYSKENKEHDLLNILTSFISFILFSILFFSSNLGNSTLLSIQISFLTHFFNIGRKN